MPKIQILEHQILPVPSGRHARQDKMSGHMFAWFPVSVHYRTIRGRMFEWRSKETAHIVWLSKRTFLRRYIYSTDQTPICN